MSVFRAIFLFRVAWFGAGPRWPWRAWPSGSSWRCGLAHWSQQLVLQRLVSRTTIRSFEVSTRYARPSCVVTREGEYISG